jgi:hypothetical protein
VPEIGKVSRKVHFYKAISQDKNGEDLPIDFQAIVERLRALPETTEGRAMVWDPKSRVTVHPSQKNDRPRILFGRTKLKDVSREETGDLKLRPLALSEGGGQADLIHVTFYPNNVVGQVYNHAAPNMNALSFFIQQRAPDLVGVRFAFAALIQEEVLKRILAFEKVTAVTFKIEGYAADLVANAGASKPLLKAARDVAEIGNPMGIQIQLTRIIDTDAVKQVVDDLANNSALAQGIRQVTVTGSNFEPVTDKTKKKPKAKRDRVNLLATSTIFEEQIVSLDNNARTLDDDDAFRVMDEVYARNKLALERAAHIESVDHEE